MSEILLLLSDFTVSFIWVSSGAINKLLVYKVLGLGLEPKGEIVKGLFSALSLFFCAWLGIITRGGSYNPLALLPGAISGHFSWFLFIICARIPVQVFGSITAANLIVAIFPEVWYGPILNVEVHLGALIEGLLTFAIVIASLEATNITSNNFFMKTWISSVCKVALHILGSDLTGGWMNPASAMAWAYVRGDLMTKEQLFVYCLAPLEATLLAVWIFRLFVKPQKREDSAMKKKRKKSD